MVSNTHPKASLVRLIYGIGGALRVIPNRSGPIGGQFIFSPKWGQNIKNPITIFLVVLGGQNYEHY